MNNILKMAALSVLSAGLMGPANAEVSGSVEAEVDLNALIDQGRGLVDSFKSEKNDLVVVIENYTNKPFEVGTFLEKKNAKTQGALRAGFTQRSKNPKNGLSDFDPTRLRACSNLAVFGWRAHDANAKMFVNVIPTYVKKPTAVTIYAASKNGGATFGYFRRGGTAANKDPKTLKNFKKIARAGTSYITVDKNMWGFSDNLKFTYNLQDGNKTNPATWTLQIRHMDSKKDCDSKKKKK